MDVLDEIDVTIREKRSKWNYTPMREKNETDAIIDELLREFSSDSSYENRSSRNSYSAPRSDVSRNSVAVQPGKPAFSENEMRRIAEAEQRERREYEESVRREQAMTRADSVNSEYDNSYDESYDDYDEDYGDSFDEYNENYDDSFNESDDGDMSRGGDFDSFMDSENDGKRGDLPKFPVSSLIKTLLKIAALAIFGAFAVAGIINTVSIAVDKYSNTSDINEADSQKKKLESVIYPLIVTGIKDFDDVSKLKDEDLINIAVWEMVINGNKTVFKDKDSDDLLLPQDQMTYIIEKLFGDNTKFSHTTTGLGDTTIIYDQKNKQYIISDDTDIYSYYPVVTDISETGDDYIVYADCYRSSPSWNNSKSVPEKRVMITMKKTSEYYNIISLKSIPVESN